MDTTGIPHPPRRVPLLGDVRGVDRRTPIQDSLRFAAELGPIFVRKFLSRETVFVAGADLAGEILDESRFAKHVGLGVEKLRAVGGDGLFTAYNSEPNWQLAHDILLPAFTAGSMRSYHPTMVDVARELVAYWDTQVDGEPVDVSADMTKLTLETIGRTGFGYEFDSFRRARPHPFVAAMTNTLRYAQRTTFVLPVIGRLLLKEAARQAQRDSEYMAGLVDEVIETRRAAGDTGTGDLLGLMLNHAHPDTGQRLDPVNIRHQVITFLVAGHETTSGALSFALYYLSRHPEVLATAQAEVDAMWGEQDDPEPSFKEAAKLRYIRQILDETLRLWPTAPAFFREARTDHVLGGRYAMRKGDWVVLLISAVQRDPEVWGPDPEAFDPDRFAPGMAKRRPAHAYKPFGTGERACIGRQFAVHEATLVLGLLLHRYHLEPDPAYRLDIAESLTIKPKDFTLRLRRRRPEERRAPRDAEATAERDEPAQCPVRQGS